MGWRRTGLPAGLAVLGALAIGAPAASAEPRPASFEFELEASNGLHAEVSTFDEEITLELTRGNRLVSYKTKFDEATEAGLKARFGSLGVLDLVFEPTKTHQFKLPPECKGPPSTYSKGVFVGRFDFTGEREYVRIEETRIKGKMGVSRESEWDCPTRYGLLRPRAETEPAVLTVADRQCRCFLVAFSFVERERPRKSFFSGGKLENQEGMEIGRSTSVRAGAAAFVFDHAAGTATLRPPRPFRGSGSFERRPHGRDLWRGSIEVPLLGADPVSFSGPGTKARLVRDAPGD